MTVKAASLRLLDSGRRSSSSGRPVDCRSLYPERPYIDDESGLDKKALSGKTIYLKDAQRIRIFSITEKAAGRGDQVRFLSFPS